jgi:hypothetical protein
MPVGSQMALRMSDLGTGRILILRKLPDIYLYQRLSQTQGWKGQVNDRKDK